MIDFERNAAARAFIRHKLRLPLLLCTALVLNACVAGLAVSALGAVAQSGQTRSESNEHLRPAAEQACSAHASQFGTVRVIDVEQRTTSKLVVWERLQVERAVSLLSAPSQPRSLHSNCARQKT